MPADPQVRREFTVLPRQGAGALRFGMTPEQIAQAMGETPRRISRGGGVDAFTGLHVHYDGGGRCEAIEFFLPSHVILDGIELSEQPFSQVAAVLEDLVEDLEIDDDGLQSEQLGVGIYAPGHDEDPDTLTDGVIVFRDGYYD